MPVPLFIVDAFTTEPYRGNPAAVCLLENAAEAAWMQKVASEMNLSETAYLVPQGDGYHLRWFTPKVEVDLCGHATLASAFVLWSQERAPSGQPIKFHTKSGLLTCYRKGEWIEMDFPAEPVADANIPPALAEGLGTSIKYVGLNRHDYLVEVANETTLRALKPDLGMLAILPVRGSLITCVSQKPEYDFFCRFFAPLAGVAEDPVTGSAHCALGPYWAKRLGKTELTSFQASARGGVVKVKANGNRVLLGGQAVMVLRGELLHLK
jgi:predicted PhzF superfamily epimerase YddE/YHI9